MPCPASFRHFRRFGTTIVPCSKFSGELQVFWSFVSWIVDQRTRSYWSMLHCVEPNIFVLFLQIAFASCGVQKTFVVERFSLTRSGVDHILSNEIALPSWSGALRSVSMVQSGQSNLLRAWQVVRKSDQSVVILPCTAIWSVISEKMQNLLSRVGLLAWRREKELSLADKAHDRKFGNANE